MTELETRVRTAAEDLARRIVATLRTMTLDELAGLVQTPGATAGARAKRPGRTAKPRKATPAKAVLPKKAGTAKAGTVIRRSDGRTFTNTAKAIAAHKLQGQYIGHLGQVPAKEKERYRTIAHEKGVAAAVAALMKRLGKA